jgi:uncharacterized protein involved in type VI secretion and phage assembly
MKVTDLIAAELAIDDTQGRMYGVVVGVVTNTDDPDSLARVKVSYPWMGDDAESPWARVVTPMAGGDRGMVFRPEVGDEVLVVFEHGDVRFPYVIGAVWNGVDGPPQHRGADGDNNVRMIRSRSGHEILLDDTSGSEKIVIVDSSESHKIELSSDGVVIISNSVKVGSASSGESLVLGDAFMQLFNQHTHPTGVGPSGPPTQQMQSGTHISSNHKTE